MVDALGHGDPGELRVNLVDDVVPVERHIDEKSEHVFAAGHAGAHDPEHVEPGHVGEARLGI
jgi:hypothetical protein